MLFSAFLLSALVALDAITPSAQGLRFSVGGFFGPGNGRRVLLAQGMYVSVEFETTVNIHNASEGLWCPRVAIDWGDDRGASAQTNDCPPYTQATDEDRALQSYGPFTHTYVQRGNFMLTITITGRDEHGKKVEKVLTPALTIR